MSSFPICQVCHQLFSLRGPAPFLLPCLHAVCERCVTSAAGGVISCTTCQRDVNLTETQLQKDVVRQKEIFHLSEYCHMMHDSVRVTQRPIVQKIGDIKPEISDKDEYCSVHSKHLLHLWDKTCKSLICRKCGRDNHTDHDLEEIEEAAKSAKMKMIQLQKDVRTTIDQHIALIDKAKTELNTFNETCDMLAEKVSNTFHSFKTALEQREKEILIGLEQHKEQVAADLTHKRKASESKHQKCMVTSDYISKSLQYSSPNVVLSLIEAVHTATENCLTTAPEGPDDVTMPTFHAVELNKLKKFLSECEIFTKQENTNLKEGQKGSAALHQSVQIEESMNVIEDLKMKLCQNEKMMKDLIGENVKIENLNQTLTCELKSERPQLPYNMDLVIPDDIDINQRPGDIPVTQGYVDQETAPASMAKAEEAKGSKKAPPFERPKSTDFGVPKGNANITPAAMAMDQADLESMPPWKRELLFKRVKVAKTFFNEFNPEDEGEAPPS